MAPKCEHDRAAHSLLSLPRTPLYSLIIQPPPRVPSNYIIAAVVCFWALSLVEQVLLPASCLVSRTPNPPAPLRPEASEVLDGSCTFTPMRWRCGRSGSCHQKFLPLCAGMPQPVARSNTSGNAHGPALKHCNTSESFRLSFRSIAHHLSIPCQRAASPFACKANCNS
jgi:hypothetical protein